MEYLGKLLNKYKKKKYSVFQDRTGLYYLNGKEIKIMTEREYKLFLKDEELFQEA